MLTIKKIATFTPCLASNYTRNDLMQKMLAKSDSGVGNKISYMNENCVLCVGDLQGIEREDGSGFCFILTIATLGNALDFGDLTVRRKNLAGASNASGGV